MAASQFDVGRSPIRRALSAIAAAVFRRRRTPDTQPSVDQSRPCAAGDVRIEPRLAETLRQRLIQEAACLERLDAERRASGDPHLGQPTEDRIVWSELIGLELQDIDERVARIRGANRESRTRS